MLLLSSWSHEHPVCHRIEIAVHYHFCKKSHFYRSGLDSISLATAPSERICETLPLTSYLRFNSLGGCAYVIAHTRSQSLGFS
jgi:hypothetical protein